MPKRALTDLAVKRLKAPAKGQVEYFDQGYPGLALRLSYGGGKSFVFFYRGAGRKLRRMTLGTYPALSLAEARNAWRTAREAAQKGLDPASEHKRKTGANDFETVLEEWLKRDQAGNRTVLNIKRLIDRDVTSEWRRRSILEITRRDVREVIAAAADRAPMTARRLHSHLHRFFQWCLEEEILEANPMAGMKKLGAESKRDRVLTDAELVAVWKAATELGWPYGPVIQLLILTGQRRGEIGGLRWSEISDGQIHLSGDRTKNGQPHTIPLSKLAAAIIEGLPHIDKSDFVFTSNGKTPITGWPGIKIRLDERVQFSSGWTLHDVRRTVATGLQKLGTNLQVIEAVLNHTSGSRSGIVGVYQRHSFDAEKRAALDAWDAHVASLVELRR